MPVLDETLPHQLQIVTDSHRLFVTCNCLVNSRRDPITEFNPNERDPRVIYSRWHREQGVKINES